MEKTSLSHTIVNYIEEAGYLTRGFVGNGPIRMEFVNEPSDSQHTIIGLKTIQSNSSFECEIYAISIFTTNSVDNYKIATNFAQSVCANKCALAGPFTYDADDKEIAFQMVLDCFKSLVIKFRK